MDVLSDSLSFSTAVRSGETDRTMQLSETNRHGILLGVRWTRFGAIAEKEKVWVYCI